MQSTCSVCGGTEFGDTESSAGRTPYISCNTCDLWSQLPVPEFPSEPWQPQVDKAVFLDLAERLMKKVNPTSVLDIGMGRKGDFSECFLDLNVPSVTQFQPYSGANFAEFLEAGTTFDLITLVHSLELFPTPVRCLEALKQLLAPDGMIFIRSILPGTSGADQFFTRESNASHPVLLSTKAIRRICADEDLTILDEWTQDALGQVDWQIRHKQDIRVSFAVAACSEEEVIGRMLTSIAPIAWEVVVYLNNCTDSTPDIITKWGESTGITTRIIDGYWDNDFARAKNEAILACEGTHVAWMDCDDVLSSDAPARILALIESRPDAPQDWRLIYGGDTFYHCRLWRNKSSDDGNGNKYKAHFHDRCHEYVQLGGYGSMKTKCEDITLRHLPKPKDAAGRNIEILTEAKAKGPQPCSICPGRHDDEGRTLFYLGNGLREAGRHEEALDCYHPYLLKGLGHHDERFWAWMYKGYCHQGLKQPDEAMKAYCQALATNSHWAEPYLAISRLKYQNKDWKSAISWAVHCASHSMPNTLMFLNTGAYKDQPWRLISWCWEHLNNLDKSIQYGEIAANKIGSVDVEWDKRLTTLRARRAGVAEVAKSNTKIFQVMRPGALGDVIMSTAACKGLKEQGYFVRYVCHPSSLDVIHDNPYVDEVVCVESNIHDELLEATKGLLPAAKISTFQYPMDEGYPEKPMRQHLARTFCEQVGVEPTTDLSVHLGQEHLDYGAQHGTGKVVIHTTAGWSPLKNWPMDWYEKLVENINELGFDVVQIGGPREAEVPGATKLVTPSIRHAIAVQKFSSLFIGGDSVFNHTSQAVGKRSVIIWGSTHPCGSGYDQNVNLVNGQVWTREMGNGGPTKECQPCYREFNAMSVHPKPPCPHLVPHTITSLPKEEYPERTISACISSNTPEFVWNHVKEILS